MNTSPWNKDRIIGQKRPLQISHIWGKRIAGTLNCSPLNVAVYATHKTPGIRPEIAGDVITLLAQDEMLSAALKR